MLFVCPLTICSFSESLYDGLECFCPVKQHRASQRKTRNEPIKTDVSQIPLLIPFNPARYALFLLYMHTQTCLFVLYIFFSLTTLWELICAFLSALPFVVYLSLNILSSAHFHCYPLRLFQEFVCLEFYISEALFSCVCPQHLLNSREILGSWVWNLL